MNKKKLWERREGRGEGGGLLNILTLTISFVEHIPETFSFIPCCSFPCSYLIRVSIITVIIFPEVFEVHNIDILSEMGVLMNHGINNTDKRIVVFGINKDCILYGTVSTRSIHTIIDNNFK